MKPVTNTIPGVVVDCLFSGNLADDRLSLVTVSGCMDSSETEMSIASSLVPGGLVDLILTQNTTKVLEQEISIGSKKYGGADYVDAKVAKRRGRFYSGRLPEYIELQTNLWYDRSLWEYFDYDDDAVSQWLARVVELAKPRLVLPSLSMKIHLSIPTAPKFIDRYLEANPRNLRILEGLPQNSIMLNSY